MKSLFLVLGSLLLCTVLYAQHPEAQSRQKNFNTSSKNLALEGYDPVSYFTGKAQKGNAKYQHTWEGITYFFASQGNLDSFLKNPEKYEPAYGGWCAYAMGAKGEKVSVSPTNYKITEGRLFLFYKNAFYNTLSDWNKDERQLTRKADQYWAKVK
jgi:YHS domain-containing protein